MSEHESERASEQFPWVLLETRGFHLRFSGAFGVASGVLSCSFLWDFVSWRDGHIWCLDCLTMRHGMARQGMAGMIGQGRAEARLESEARCSI